MLKFLSDKTERLDKYLAAQIPEVSRGKIQKAIKDGLVLVNDKKIIVPHLEVKIGDQIELPEFESEELKPSSVELKVVYENEDCAVIDKPAGLVVHPGAGNTENTLAQALLTRYPGIEKVGEPHRPGIVHRLDEDTSGLILIAKNQASLEYFKKQFQEHKVEKEYLALVHGTLSKKHGIIDVALEKVPLKQKMKVGSGKEAITEYWVLSSSRPSEMGEARPIENGAAGQFSLIRVKLHTGRTHQIRAHLSHIGHPLLGDKVYGAGFKLQDAQILDRQFLHAYRLKFQLMDKTWLELKSDLPEELKAVLVKLNIPQ